MFVAYDKNDNRIYANGEGDISECHCPVCGAEVIRKNGHIRRPHFAHKSLTECKMSTDNDYKSEWHWRMQNYFPVDYLERRFINPINGEIHIADVFLPDNNIVIEFQHSPIDVEEFNSRTNFHIEAGRKIIWVFDETKPNAKPDEYGPFIRDNTHNSNWPYTGFDCKWKGDKARRYLLSQGLDFDKNQNCYQVYVSTGQEGENVIRRIRRPLVEDFSCVQLFYENVHLSRDMDYEYLMHSDAFWLMQDKYKDKAELLFNEIYKHFSKEKTVYPTLQKPRYYKRRKRGRF